MRLMAEDLLALLDKLEIEKAVIAGHSMGGYVSLAFAHAFPSRLAGLGLIATQAEPDSPERRQNRIKQAEEIGRKGVKILADGMAPKLSPYESMQSALIDSMKQANPKAVIAALKGMAERVSAAEWLASIEVPAVVVHGEQDALIPIEKSRTMAQLLPRGWMVELPCAGHMPMIEMPPGVADPLRMLLEMVKQRQ
jgi:3-oxoadipate enol-lactonase